MKLCGNLPHKNLVHFIAENLCGEAEIEHVDSFAELEEAIGRAPVEESTEEGHGELEA